MPGAPTAPAGSPMLPGWPQVTFEPDDSRARLERLDRTDGGNIWSPVCQGTCTQNLDRRHAYRVDGDGVVRSSWFYLPRSEDPMRLKTDTGSSAARMVGIALAVTGPLVAAGGVLVMASGDSDRKAWDDRTVAGTTLALSGGVLLLTGLALIGFSSTTNQLERAPGAPPPMTSKKGVQIGLDGVKF